MNIEDFIDSKETIILSAMGHPGLAPKRKPTIEQAMKAVASEVEMVVMKAVQNRIEPLMHEMYEMYTLMNGDWGDIEASTRDDYSSGLDDQLEALLEPYESLLSADWLGRNTIDTRLWEEGAIPKLAKSAGKEVYKQISYNKTPAKVLSSAGIVQADVELYLQHHLDGKIEKRTEPMENNSTLEDVAAKIKAHVGKDFDQMAVYEDLELACDDDEILAAGAGKRIGLDEEDLQALQFGVLDYGDELPQHVFELVEKAEDTKVKKKTAKRVKKSDEDASPGVDPQVLALLKAHGGAKDTEMATALGVSRATYNNWINGKNTFSPDADQHATLRDRIITDTNGLLEALALLDGTEQMAVS